MCGPLIDSSPLSSPGSPLPAAPGAWNSAKASRDLTKTDSVNTKNAATPPPAPVSPGSTKSTTSNMSKKRSRRDSHDPSTPVSKSKKLNKVSKPSSPRTSTRPTRSRKAPERFTDMKEPPKKPAAPRKTASKVFDPVYITTNSTSRLGKADIYHMLLEDAPWVCLTLAQKQILLDMLPKSQENVVLLSKIVSGEAAAAERPREFSRNFNLFRTDVAKFVEDLKNGHLAKGWQAAAQQAVVERAAGLYDEWKAEEAELWWGQN